MAGIGGIHPEIWTDLFDAGYWEGVPTLQETQFRVSRIDLKDWWVCHLNFVLRHNRALEEAGEEPEQSVAGWPLHGALSNTSLLPHVKCLLAAGHPLEVDAHTDKGFRFEYCAQNPETLALLVEAGLKLSLRFVPKPVYHDAKFCGVFIEHATGTFSDIHKMIQHTCLKLHINEYDGAECLSMMLTKYQGYTPTLSQQWELWNTYASQHFHEEQAILLRLGMLRCESQYLIDRYEEDEDGNLEDDKHDLRDDEEYVPLLRIFVREQSFVDALFVNGALCPEKE